MDFYGKNFPGVLTEWYVQPILDKKVDFFGNITDQMKKDWLKTHPKSVEGTVKDYLVQYLGQGIHELIRYVKQLNSGRQNTSLAVNRVNRKCHVIGPSSSAIDHSDSAGSVGLGPR